MGETKTLDKKTVIDKLLEQEYVLVHVNSNASDLKLPEYLLTQPSVTLKLSRLFRFPVQLHEDKLAADLLFKGEYFSCSVPWEAVWGATSAEGKGRVWPEAIPTSLMHHLLTHSQEGPPTDTESAKMLVDESSEKESATPVSKGTRGHLRRIK